MKLLFAGTVPKDTSFPEANEDAFALSIDGAKVVLCDGASESFDSKTWANILVGKISQSEKLDALLIDGAIKEYEENYSVQDLTWSKQAAFERGSFSTALLIENISNKFIDLTAVGDSVVILLDNNRLVDSFPYTHSHEFKQRPELLCTNREFNTFISSLDFLASNTRCWSIERYESPVMFCMTDALGEWALRHFEDGNPQWDVLNEINDIHSLERLVLDERATKRMRVDDATFLKLSCI